MISDLPATRISPIPTFLRCGVDYADPFQIKALKGRGSKLFKVCIAFLSCFTIRVIHLELVTDLSSDAFLQFLGLYPAEANAGIYTEIVVPTLLAQNVNSWNLKS
ncbi:reverse transcriptase [Caerostris darwini]|uniref:Reverse transcriptase n=1 Tax=Caerostris darwini TaxID=1538125 RepID=A0AAV4NYN4_9ARAC|nr:reverse transcriptase [Caerostris darwini]